MNNILCELYFERNKTFILINLRLSNIMYIELNKQYYSGDSLFFMLTTRYNILELKQLTNGNNKAFLFLLMIIYLLKNEYNRYFDTLDFQNIFIKLLNA